MIKKIDDERQGNYMHTFSGDKYWPMNPRPEEVKIADIAHSLATKCRYGGHCLGFYSVAEHSVYCSYYGDEETALERLMHDAAEAYNGDLIRPLKRDAEFAKPFQKVELMNEKVIFEKYNLQFPYPASVKIADEAITAAEVAQIIRVNPNEDWEIGKLHDDSVVAEVEIKCLEWKQAEMLFLQRFYELAELRGIDLTNA